MAQKKKVRRPKSEYSKKQIEKVRRDAWHEAVHLTSKLAVAVMVQNHHLTEEEVFKDMQDIARWSQAYKEHLLSVKEIDDIIDKMGGIKFLNI